MGFPTHIVAAAGYVFDKEGNVLIIKTLNRGYDTTGGQIEEGEDLEAGVLREIMEESWTLSSSQSVRITTSPCFSSLHSGTETGCFAKVVAGAEGAS